MSTTSRNDNFDYYVELSPLFTKNVWLHTLLGLIMIRDVGVKG